MTMSDQFFRFTAVGGVATVFHYAILILLVQAGLAQPVVASSIGFAASAILNYGLNRKITFRSTRRHAEAFPRFALVSGTGLGLNGVCLWLLLSTGLVHYLVSQMIATAVTLVWNFAINRAWTFGSSKILSDAQRETYP